MPAVVVADQRDVGAGAAHVEGDDIRAAWPSAPCGSRRPRRRRAPTERCAPGSGARARSTSGRRCSGRCRRGVCSCLASRSLESREVAAHHRLQIGVEHRGRESLVLRGIPAAPPKRARHATYLSARAQRLGNAALVCVLDKREQETDSARLRTGLRHFRDGVLQRQLVERGDRSAHRRLCAPRPRSGDRGDQRLRLIDLQRIEMRARLAADLEKITKAAGRDQGDARRPCVGSGRWWRPWCRGGAARSRRDLWQIG